MWSSTLLQRKEAPRIAFAVFAFALLAIVLFDEGEVYDGSYSKPHLLDPNTSEARALSYMHNEVNQLSAESVDEPVEPRAALKTIDLAVCFVGAVRSFMEPELIQAVRDMKIPADTHLFHYLYVGKELSAKGQEALTTGDADAMADALANSAAFKFQYQENDFICSQMSTGKFFKISACANMIDAYSREKGVVFKSIVFMRPDLLWRCPEFPAYSPKQIIDYKEDWYVHSNDEVIAVSGNVKGLMAAKSVKNAQCCDSELRTPKDCFPDRKLIFPEVNFMQHWHFSTHLNSRKTSFNFGRAAIDRWGRSTEGCHAMIKRTSYQNRNGSDWRTLNRELHGKFRALVLRCTDPQTSPVIDSFQTIDKGKRKELIEQLLSVPVGTECANEASSKS